MNRAFREASRSGPVRFALFLVILTASVLAFFVCKTFVDPGQRQYAPDFGRFPWIEPPHPSPAGYFRGTFYLPQAVERGWVEIAATDHFLLYVNGALVNETYFGDERVTGIFDIRSFLVQGKNVIAVYVPRTFAPGSSQVRLRGAYATAGARDQEIGTTALWKASNTPDHVIDSYQWFDVGLDDSRWAAARPAKPVETFSTVQALTVPTRLFANETRAQWIGSHDAAAQTASFTGTFTLPARRGESWLQVASNGAYDVFINGCYAIAQPSVQTTILPFAQMSGGGPATVLSTQLTGLAALDQAATHTILPLQIPVVPSVPTLLAYDVSRWLRSGENRIIVRVRADNVPPLLLGDLSTLLRAGGGWHFATGHTWTVNKAKRGGAEPARELGENGIAPWGHLPQAAAMPTYTPATDLVKYGPWALGMTLAVAGFVLAWLLTALLYRPGHGRPVRPGAPAGCRPARASPGRPARLLAADLRRAVRHGLVLSARLVPRAPGDPSARPRPAAARRRPVSAGRRAAAPRPRGLAGGALRQDHRLRGGRPAGLLPARVGPQRRVDGLRRDHHGHQRRRGAEKRLSPFAARQLRPHPGHVRADSLHPRHLFLPFRAHGVRLPSPGADLQHVDRGADRAGGHPDFSTGGSGWSPRSSTAAIRPASCGRATPSILPRSSFFPC